jgi:hypothetical protein
MKRTWTIIGVGDVSSSLKWYQARFGQPATLGAANAAKHTSGFRVAIRPSEYDPPLGHHDLSDVRLAEPRPENEASECSQCRRRGGGMPAP